MASVGFSSIGWKGAMKAPKRRRAGSMVSSAPFKRMFGASLGKTWAARQCDPRSIAPPCERGQATFARRQDRPSSFSSARSALAGSPPRSGDRRPAS